MKTKTGEIKSSLSPLILKYLSDKKNDFEKDGIEKIMMYGNILH